MTMWLVNASPMSCLATDFSGKPILDISLASWTYSTEGKQDSEENASIRIHWGQGQIIDTHGRHFVVGDFVTLANYDAIRWTHYLTYDVAAEYQGKKVSYRASFLFDDTGNAEAHDPFIPGLNGLVKANTYPAVLLKHLSGNPTVAEWIKANTAPAEVQTKPNQLTCNAESMKCCLPSDAVAVSDASHATAR